LVAEIEKDMKKAADELNFEKAAQLRDMIKEITAKKPRSSRVNARKKTGLPRS
jgi:excinuclease UvrABC nuclease subunit